jgi:hypothetical protein
MMEKQNSNEPARENKDLPEREASEAAHAGLMEPEQGLSKDMEDLRKDLREANF